MSNIDKQALRQLATDAHELGIIKRYSKGLEAQRKFYAAATPLVILALLDELEALQSFRTAYMEWSDKTDWVQTDKRFDVIKPWGKHRADVLKLYIDHLESKLEAERERSEELLRQARSFREAHESASEIIRKLERNKPTVKLPTTRLWAGKLACYEESEVVAMLEGAGISIAAGIGKGA